MIAPKHILGTFDEALASLRNNVLMMSSLTERSLDRAITGLLQRDDELCAIAIADDEEIDQLEKQVDKDGIDLLLRFQPVASDLRRVVSAMKLSSNLERMADQGTNIARRARKLNQHPPLPETELITPMYEREGRPPIDRADGGRPGPTARLSQSDFCFALSRTRWRSRHEHGGRRRLRRGSRGHSASALRARRGPVKNGLQVGHFYRYLPRLDGLVHLDVARSRLPLWLRRKLPRNSRNCHLTAIRP